MLYRLCNVCSKKVAYGTKCVCEVNRDKERHRQYKRNRNDKDIQRIYTSKQWRLVRQQALFKAHGLCEMCMDEDVITYADEVHHKQSIKDGGSVYDLNNLICLCHKCHMLCHAND